MTLALPPARPLPVAVDGRREGRIAATLARPGVVEKALVITTIFVLIHELPNTWFKTRADLIAEQSNPLAVLAGMGLMGLGIARIIGSIDHLIALVRTEGAAFAFVGITMASTFWSVDPPETFEKSVVFATVTLYAGYLVLRFSLQEILKLLSLQFCLSALLNLAFVLALPVYGVGPGDDGGQVWTGVFGQKNALGFFAAVAVPTLVVAARSLVRWRFVLYGAALMWMVLLLGSQSKTMLLATVIPTLLLVVYNLFRSRYTLRGAVLVSLFGSSAFTVLFATANLAVLAGWLNKDVTLTGRIPIWKLLTPIALERPFTGYGYKATFTGYFSPVHDLWAKTNWQPTHAHNAALQILLEIGVFGLIAFLVCYFRAVSRAIKIVAIVPGAIGLWPMSFLTTTLLVSITESGMASNNVGWLMFMLAVLTVSGHLQHRTSVGLSNDLREALATQRSSARPGGPGTGRRWMGPDAATPPVAAR